MKIYDAALFWLDSVFCLLAAPILISPLTQNGHLRPNDRIGLRCITD